MTEGMKEGMTEGRNDGRTRQIQYSSTFSKRGYNHDYKGWPLASELSLVSFLIL